MALDQEALSETSGLLFYKAGNPMEKFFEQLVRANFRFGRMCCCQDLETYNYIKHFAA
ncbi:MAG: hypothetical protein IJZ85_01715 [Lachnospiraceae bacterium]|nr:hypothetical protein [Lachnospiraceae bacterium]